MKIFPKFKIVAILFATIICFASCKKKSDPAPAPDPTPVPTPAPAPTPTPPANGEHTDVALISFEDLFAMADGPIADEKRIKGVVISKKADKNFPSAEVAIQNGSVGLVVRFSADHDFAAGDEIEVLLKDSKLETINDLHFIDVASDDKALKIGSGTVSPKEVTISEFMMPQNQGVLVTIKDVDFNITTSSVFNDGTVSEFTTVGQVGSDKFRVRVMKDATFAGETIPTTKSTITGIAYKKSLYPRDKADAIQ